MFNSDIFRKLLRIRKKFGQDAVDKIESAVYTIKEGGLIPTSVGQIYADNVNFYLDTGSGVLKLSKIEVLNIFESDLEELITYLGRS